MAMDTSLKIERFMFIGSKHMGLSALKKIHALSPDRLCSVVTLEDCADGMRSKLKEFDRFSKKTGKKLHVLSNLAALESVINEEAPDLCIVVGWYRILGKDILEKVPAGVVGIHASLLPKYRGGAPLVWAVINGEGESGVSLFFMDEGMDTGDIIGQSRFSIGENDAISEVLTAAESGALGLLDKHVPSLLMGTAPRASQDHTQASYGSQRGPVDGRIFWEMTNIRIHNAVRAQTKPYPGAFCTAGESNKLTIWSSTVFPGDYYGSPGLVAQKCRNGVVVTCGQGAICINNVQIEGEDVTTADRILHHGMRLQ